jgi:hypothetical protein
MRNFLSLRNATAFSMMLLMALCLMSAGSALAQTQANAADLNGTVTDPNGAVVTGATVTARNSATGITKTVNAGSDGRYSIIGLPPGEYEVTAEAANFKKYVVSGVRLTVGSAADLTLKLEVGTPSVVVNVSADEVQLVEPTRSSVANTIDQQRIQNLPINQRDATGFALTLSTVGRDNGRPIGPAPTSGLNIGGQRGRSTQVNVDGADFTDNSINASRTTVSMEAVQEYQVATNSYTPEFGRATGGVINVVTKRGTNDVHGSLFGFLRDKRVQARNAFAPVAKPDFRRTQWGGTIGAPLVKDQSFIFGSFERRSRDESGFFTSDVAAGLNGSVTIGAPFLPFTQTFGNITPTQASSISGLLAKAAQLIGTGTPGNIAQGQALANAAVQYATLASSGGYTALLGTNPLISPGGAVPAGQVVGQRFFISGAPVPVSNIAFRPLTQLQKVFPVTERTNFSSVRFDFNLNPRNQFSVRVGYNTSHVTGIQVESQNQSLGQNDFSRTGITNIKDTSFTSNLVSSLSGTMVNDLRFSFGRRKTSFLSQNGGAVAYNISGTAFIGRELFSPVDRTEERWQLLDSLTWVKDNHTFKFGGDANAVLITRAHFELNFAGLFNFGNFAAANLNSAFAPLGLPDFTPVQSYGLGLPSLYLQGFGNPDSRIGNKPLSFFAQDSWKLTKRLTLNYGVRYDVELTQTVAPVGFRDPLTGITLSSGDILAAQDAMGVQQGVPRDKNNWQPRIGFAYDMLGNGRTVLRGNIGLYYDHPLLAVAFNSDIADAAQQQQAVLTAGSPIPSNTNLLNAALVFQGTVCGNQGSSAAVCAGFGNPVTPGVAASAQYQFGRQRFNDQTFTGFGPVLPFVLPVAKNFEYASATQANLGIEHQIGKNMSVSATYMFVGAHHLPHPTDLNPPNTALQIQNYVRCFGTNPGTTQDVSTVDPTKCGYAGHAFVNVIPGIISVDTTTGARVIAPAIANFFRPNAPNYFLAFAASGGLVSKAVLDSQLGGTLRTPGVLTPFGSVNAQLSDGNSIYHAGLFELKRRFANNFTFLASYTWSHSIDDSSDLQTLLIAQDVRNFRAERADSLFDQRHRFVFSGVVASPDAWRKGDGWQRFLSNFTVAPIFEWSSGRPFNIITNVDANNDQSTQTDRPSVNADGTLCVPGSVGCITPLISGGQFSTGNLPRNAGTTHSFQSLDLRVARAFRIGERAKIEVIAEGFNLFNRFNEASASPFFTDVNAFHQRASNGRYYSRPTAAFDPRQFQFGARLNW